MRTLPVHLLLPSVLLVGCSSAEDETGTPMGTEFSDCDPIAYDYCALPFPSSFYERADASSPTGVRVRLGATTIPHTDQGEASYQPLPDAWNRLDGFSPLTPLLARFEDLDISGLPGHANMGDSLLDTSNVLVFDADTGERHPVWAELDVSGARDPGDEMLFIRAARPYANGHRYIVALRGLKDTSGATIAASDGFAALRDGTPTDTYDIEGRRELYEDIFSRLSEQGWSRGDTVLAWDFHVGSKEGITGRAVHVRDDALAQVGAAGPSYTIDSITDFTAEEDPSICRNIEGTFTAPLYTNKDRPGAVLNVGDDGMPYADGTTDVKFRIRVPRTACDDPRPMKLLQYGHGLLGSINELDSGYLGEVANRYGYVLFGVDWTGMKNEDSSEIAAMLVTDLSNFHMIPERSHQGFVEFVLAAQMMQGAMAQDPALALAPPAGGDPVGVVDTSSVWYYGNSQGGILGGAYLALSPVIERGTLGVPGAPYSLLLSRSSDFTPFFGLFQAIYPKQEDIAFWMALLQQLWDSGEASGYANHMVSDLLPGVPPKQALVQDAIGDAQVTTLGAHVMARAYGGVQVGTPIEELYGIPTVEGPWIGSALAEYAHGAPPVPDTNIPPDDEYDTHEDTRRTLAAQEQMDTFFRTGEVRNYCDGACDPE